MFKSTDPIVYISDAHTGTDDYKSRASRQKSLFDKRKSSRTNVVHLKRQLSPSRLRQQRELPLRIEFTEGDYYEVSENASNEDISETVATKSDTIVLPMPKKYLIFCFCCGIIAAGSVVAAAMISARDTASSSCQPPHLRSGENTTEFDEPWRLDNDGSDLIANNDSYTCELRKNVRRLIFSADEKNVWVEGSASEKTNDARSSVNCPPGRYVASCKCKDPLTCDGAVITSITKCEVVANGIHPGGAVPRAFCVRGRAPRLIFGRIFNTRKPIGCPEGHRVQSCSLMDYWSLGRETAVLTYTNGCAWSRIGSCMQWCDNPIQLSATCFRID